MAIPPKPRLVLILQRSTGVDDSIASWQLPTDDAVDVTPGVVGIDDAVSWTTQWAPQQGAVIGMATPSAILFGVDNVTATTNTRYLPAGYALGSAPQNVLAYRFPVGGTLSSFRVRHNTPNGNGAPIVYTVLLNGAPTALQVSLPSTSLDGSELVSAVPVVAGDLLSIQVTKAAGVGTSPMEITASLAFE